MSLQNAKLIKKISSEKYPLLIALGFFLITSYIAFFHHNYWVIDQDGIFFLKVGEQILQGDWKNVLLTNIPVGGPIFFATLNLFFNDGFSLMKLISVLSGTGTVFVVYYITKNIFNSKIAFSNDFMASS